jgi:hypothetical protein
MSEECENRPWLSTTTSSFGPHMSTVGDHAIARRGEQWRAGGSPAALDIPAVPHKSDRRGTSITATPASAAPAVIANWQTSWNWSLWGAKARSEAAQVSCGSRRVYGLAEGVMSDVVQTALAASASDALSLCARPGGRCSRIRRRWRVGGRDWCMVGCVDTRQHRHGVACSLPGAQAGISPSLMRVAPERRQRLTPADPRSILRLRRVAGALGIDRPSWAPSGGLRADCHGTRLRSAGRGPALPARC